MEAVLALLILVMVAAGAWVIMEVIDAVFWSNDRDSFGL